MKEKERKRKRSIWGVILLPNTVSNLLEFHFTISVCLVSSYEELHLENGSTRDNLVKRLLKEKSNRFVLAMNTELLSIFLLALL